MGYCSTWQVWNRFQVLGFGFQGLAAQISSKNLEPSTSCYTYEYASEEIWRRARGI